MDFLYELIFEVILECVFGATIENPKVKTWFKTTMYLLLAEGAAILIGIASVSMYRTGNISYAIVCGVIALALGIGFLIGGIYGHKRDWKQD